MYFDTVTWSGVLFIYIIMVIHYLNKKLYREHKEKLKVSLVLSEYKVIFFDEHNLFALSPN